MRKLIHVTQEDIDKATRDLALSGENGVYRDRTKVCPVAKAVRREVGFTEIQVCDRIAFLDNKTVVFPRSVVRFINRYDHGKPVNPFNFILKD